MFSFLLRHHRGHRFWNSSSGRSRHRSAPQTSRSGAWQAVGLARRRFRSPCRNSRIRTSIGAGGLSATPQFVAMSPGSPPAAQTINVVARANRTRFTAPRTCASLGSASVPRAQLPALTIAFHLACQGPAPRWRSSRRAQSTTARAASSTSKPAPCVCDQRQRSMLGRRRQPAAFNWISRTDQFRNRLREAGGEIEKAAYQLQGSDPLLQASVIRRCAPRQVTPIVADERKDNSRQTHPFFRPCVSATGRPCRSREIGERFEQAIA